MIYLGSALMMWEGETGQKRAATRAAETQTPRIFRAVADFA